MVSTPLRKAGGFRGFAILACEAKSYFRFQFSGQIGFLPLDPFEQSSSLHRSQILAPALIMIYRPNISTFSGNVYQINCCTVGSQEQRLSNVTYWRPTRWVEVIDKSWTFACWNVDRAVLFQPSASLSAPLYTKVLRVEELEEVTKQSSSRHNGEYENVRLGTGVA